MTPLRLRRDGREDQRRWNGRKVRPRPVPLTAADLNPPPLARLAAWRRALIEFCREPPAR